MDLPAVEIRRTSDELATKKELRFASADKLNELQRVAMRTLLLGMTPEDYIGNKTPFRVVLLWAVLGVFHTAFATYEAVLTMFFARNLLETVSHGYITTYLFAFHCQWIYMIWIIPKLHSSPIRVEDFNCTKSRPESFEKIVDGNLKFLTRVLVFSISWWMMNSLTHIIGPAIEAIVSFAQHGHVVEVFILPQVFQLPFWGQIIMYLSNAVTMIGLIVYCASSYTIMGVQVTKIKILCEILNEAMATTTDSSQIRGYIEDHANLIKRAKELNHQLSRLNGFMFSACYLEIATQLFVMVGPSSLAVVVRSASAFDVKTSLSSHCVEHCTQWLDNDVFTSKALAKRTTTASDDGPTEQTLFDPNGAYYLAVTFDLLSISLILVLQCFMGSQITHSLESITHGPYDSKWYEEDKARSRHVQLILQMAQKSFEQTIWFGSIKVERPTTLSLLRASYAAYTVLMIFQKE